jgi:hypothetical protein
MSNLVTYAGLMVLSKQLNSNRVINVFKHDDMLDAVKYALGILAMNFILFREDGSITEHKEPPDPPTLTSYLYAKHGDEWFGVEIPNGTNEVCWITVDAEDVPGGIRTMLMLINS